LHGDRFAALGFNVCNDAISAFLARGIVDDDSRTFGRERCGGGGREDDELGRQLSGARERRAAIILWWLYNRKTFQR
jgi:hypothetical protein